MTILLHEIRESIETTLESLFTSNLYLLQGEKYHHDIVLRAYVHVSNQHKELLDVQVKELRQMANLLFEIFSDVDEILAGKRPVDLESVNEKDKKIRELAEKLHEKQLERIRDGSSKTRHSILCYAIIGNMMAQSKQNLKLLQIYAEVVGHIEGFEEFDME